MRSLLLIIAVAGAYALLRGWPDGPGLLLRACLAVAALVAGLAVWGGRRKSGGRRSRMQSLRRATLLDYLSLGLAVVFIEACFVVFTSTAAGPAQDVALVIREQVAGIRPGESDAESKPTGDEPSFDGERSGPWIFKRNLERDLPLQSNFEPGNRPEVFMELENKATAMRLLASRIHLRAFAFSRFNGTSWSAVPSARALLRKPVSFPTPPALTDENPPVRHRIYHGVNPTGQNVFSALQGARSTDISELTRLAESVYVLPALQDQSSGYEYSATSRPVHFTDLLGKKVTPAPAAEGELALPAALAEQLDQTAEAFKTEPDTASRLIALRSYLRDNYRYSLETTNADGANPLENFLYQEKRGYCEHFATAAAMLCRALGVPSRIAYGWSGGRFYQGQNMFVFRAKDAHAWTEIKIRGYGWVVFDTTPPDADAVPEAHTAPAGEKAPDPVEALAPGHPDKSSAHNDPGLAPGAEVSRAKMATLLAVLCLGMLVFLAMRYRRKSEHHPGGCAVAPPQPGYLLHFKQACAALGQPMPTGRTLRQQIAALEKTDTAPEFAGDLLGYHYQLLYADTGKNPNTEKQLNRKIRRWRKHHSA